MSALIMAQLKELTQSIATEVVFAEPGKDGGLLPINSLLGQAEDLLGEGESFAPLSNAIRAARRWVDEIFEGPGTFSETALRRFTSWTAWMQAAIPAIEQQTPPPAIPSDWGSSVTVTPSAPAASSLVSPEQESPSPDGEPTLHLNLENDAELLREFINESVEHLQNIEEGVLVLEENPTDADTLNSIFRAFHTFKGGSGFMNLGAIQRLAHELESLLDCARTGKLHITSEVINLILEGGDTLKRFMVEMEGQLTGRSAVGAILVPTLGLLARIRTTLDGRITAPKTSAGQGCAPAPVDTQSPPKPLDTSTTQAQVPAPPQTEEAVPTNQGPQTETARGKAASAGAAVKVDTQKLDSLVDLVGEMVIAQSLVVQNRALTRIEDQQLTRDLAQLGRITKDLQRTAMSLRMVPIRQTFHKMNRLVRDIAAKTGKQVELLMEGEETELDRTIVEEIGDPLVHMIRNALDHGIENSETRVSRGKPAHGTVWLRAFYQGGNIVIQIQDDGNGINKQRVLEKAIEKGLVPPGADLPDNEIYNLIFAPGFSTAETVTELSGRGVGMDVVRRNIDRLRGKVDIQSVVGEGSTFSISLPLTLAIIDGLIVGVGGQRYILPTLSVCESFRPSPGMISTVRGRGEMVTVRGKLRPVMRLYQSLGLEPASTDPTQSIAVMVEAGSSARCILVDELLGKQEVVIKSLGETFKGNRMLAGAAILGDGRVGLILDPDSLVHLEKDSSLRTA